jgi:hypothetical protein
MSSASGCGCVCVLIHRVRAAAVEVPNLPSLKCSSHWSLGLYPASVDEQCKQCECACGRAGESSSDCIVVERTRKHLFFPDVKNRERRGG